MSTTYKHVRMSVVDSSNNVTVLYPESTASDITVSRTNNTNIPSSVTQMQQLADSLKSGAFTAVGTAATKNSTNAVTNGSASLVESGAVYTEVNSVKQALDNLTATVSDNEPYILRQGKGNMVDFDLVGGSLGWNQLIQNGNFTNTTGWTATGDRGTLSASNNVLTYTIVAIGSNATQNNIRCDAPFAAGHKYLMKCDIKSNVATSSHLSTYNGGTAASDYSDSISVGWNTVETVMGQDSDANNLRIAVDVRSGFSIGDTLQFRNVNVFDLTAMFGPTIADYIYSLEQANAGDGVAWFRQYFPNVYYAYDAGSLQHVNPSTRYACGKNLCPYADSVSDSTKTFILPKGTYTFSFELRGSARFSTSKIGIASIEDLDRVVNISISGKSVGTVLNASFTVDKLVTVYVDGTNVSAGSDGLIAKNIQVEIGSTATDYVPYDAGTADIPKVPLYGVPQLVNNKLAYDGDIRKADGTVTRKYGIVDLGSKNWSGQASDYFYAYLISSKTKTLKLMCPKFITSSENNIVNHVSENIIAISSGNNILVYAPSYTDAATFKTAMSGVYLVYELATPTTETVAPFQNPQRAFTDGIEEFVYDSGVAVPVGNDSTYYLNETLPQPLDYADGAVGIVSDKVDSYLAFDINYQILNNEDLNSYTKAGMYYCQSSSVASTLGHCPVSVGFGMKVIRGNGAGTFLVQQIDYINTTPIAKYMRISNNSGASWTSWYKFEGTEVS